MSVDVDSLERELDTYISALVDDLSLHYSVPPSQMERMLRKTMFIWDKAQTIDQALANPEFRQHLTEQDTRVNSFLRFEPSIQQALSYLNPEQAFVLFESYSLETLRCMERDFNNACHFLQSMRGVPAWDIVSDVKHSRLVHARRNLESTGFSGYCLTGRGRIGDLYSVLYPTKFPIAAEVSPLSDREYRIEYRWSVAYHDGQILPPHSPDQSSDYGEYIGEAMNHPAWRAYLNGERTIRVLSYEDTPHAPQLTTEDVSRISRDRGGIFEMRLDIMNLLANHLHSKQPSDIWDACIQRLRSQFRTDDLEFYRKYESRVFQQCFNHLVLGDFPITTRIEHHASIDWLLFEIEIASHGVASGQVGEWLGHLQRFCDNDPYTGYPYLPFKSYFEAVSVLGESVINPVILKLEETGCWPIRSSPGWKQRIDDILESELDTHVNIQLRIPKWQERIIVPLVTSFAEWARSLVEQTTRANTAVDVTDFIRRIVVQDQDQQYAQSMFGSDAVQDRSGFRPSPDYLTVYLDDQAFILNEKEASAIEFLHQKLKSGFPNVPKNDLIDAACGDNPNVTNVRDIFSDRETYKALVSHEGKGLYRLNARLDT